MHLLHLSQCGYRWQAIHEAARGGHYDILLLLVQNGADVSSKTRSGETPLWWARQSLDNGHAVIRYLEKVNAADGSNDDLLR